MTDLHTPSTNIPLLWCDNQSAIALANNPVFHARTKHVEVYYHFIREKVLNKLLNVEYIPSEIQIADIFTKPLNSPQFQKLKSLLPMSLVVARCSPEGHHLEGGCQRSSPAGPYFNTDASQTAAETASFNPAVIKPKTSAGSSFSGLESSQDTNGLKFILAFDNGLATQPSQLAMSPTVSKDQNTSAVQCKEWNDSSARVKEGSEEELE